MVDEREEKREINNGCAMVWAFLRFFDTKKREVRLFYEEGRNYSR